MAKITVLGDTIQIKLDLTKTDFEKVQNYAPDTLKIKNKEGDEVFGISVGNAHWSKYGVAFSGTDADGKLFMTTANPVQCHQDPEAEKKAIKEAFAQTIFFLENIEKNFAEMKEQLNILEANAEASITIA